MRLKNVGGMLGVLSLGVALLAFYPSIALFTPAVFVSFIALAGAIIGGISGWVRTAILTVYVVVATVLVSPISSWIENHIDLGLLVVVLVTVFAMLAGSLYGHYRHMRQKT